MEDARTALRYFKRGSESLFFHDSESRLVASKRDFYGDSESEFIPLNEQDAHTQVVEFSAPQSKEIPGAFEGKIPGLSAFHDPDKTLAKLFSPLHFNTDQYTLKSKEYFTAIQKIASYLKKHPNTYVFILGHTDERASEAYNLALGTRRSNYIRNSLIKSGVNPDQLFTISYGKERPIDRGHNEKAWAKNRRVVFKLYERG